MNPFYISEVQEDQALLEGEEARHCIKVLRFKRGDQVVGVDGRGNMYISRIRDLGKNVVYLDLVEKHENWGEKEPEIILLASPLRKVDRFEWLLEKSVELGVNAIYPFVSKHTVKPTMRRERLERIMISALKQCQRSRLPILEEPEPFEDLILSKTKGIGLFAQAGEEQRISDHAETLRGADPVVLVVGPEGDFADEELSMLRDAGYLGLNLGTNRLRSETAAIHLISLIKHYLGY